jgi:ketosteroid isomerase-like protein
MSRENVELVQRVLEHFMATGEPPWELLDEEVEVSDHDTPDQGEYWGHAGFRRWLEEWGAAWAKWSIEPEEFIDDGDRIVAVIRMKTEGQGSGIATERQDAMVIAIRGGKLLRVDYYNNRAQALESLGRPLPDAKQAPEDPVQRA